MARIAGTVLAVLLVASSVSAQGWRGEGRLRGKVVDEQGKALPNVIVQARFPQVAGAAVNTKTDKRGEWVVEDIAEGTWELIFQLDGFAPVKANAEVDGSRRGEFKTILKKAVDANAFIQAEAKKADELLQQKKFAEARAIYEGIIAKVPQVEASMQMYLARSYYAEGQIPKAVEHLRTGLAKEPTNEQIRMLLASMLAQSGNVDEAKQVASSLDESKLPTADLYLDLSLALIQQKKAAEALPYLDKAVERFPQEADAYYYRASALIELVNQEKDPQNPERIARLGRIQADLNKFLEISPNAPQAPQVKQLLAQLAPK